MRSRYLAELSGPAAAALLAAEAQSLRYWRTGSLTYADRVADGFFEVSGAFPEVCPAGEFPHLAALLQVVPKPDTRREVILVDRRYDRNLVAMREEARSAVARACGDGGDSHRLACFQALANVVAGHMGGVLDSQPAAAEQWCALINRIKVQSASVVVPIGLLHMGAARHRALLFKVLAGDLDLPCRVVRGPAGGDVESTHVVVCLGDEEMYIDLLARPGEVAPVPQKERLAVLPTSSAAAGEAGATPSAGVRASAGAASAGLAAQLNWSSSLPSSLLVAGSVISQPLPSLHHNFSSCLDSDATFGSAPLPPLEALPPEMRRRLLASGSAGPASRMASAGAAAPLKVTLPHVRLSEEEQALLAAVEAPGRRRPARQASLLAATGTAAPVDAQCWTERLSNASRDSNGASQLMPQRTLPLPVQQQWPAQFGPESLVRSLTPTLSVEQSSQGSQTLEQALNLAAAAAMGGDSLLQRRNSRGMKTAASAALPTVRRARAAAASAGELELPTLSHLSLADGRAAAPGLVPGGEPAAGGAQVAAAAEAAGCLAAGTLPSRRLVIPASQLASSSSLPSPFGGPMSPFAAMAGFSDSEEDEGAAAEGSDAARQAAEEGQLSDGVEEEDQGVDLAMDLASSLPHKPSVESEDALIEATLDAELGPISSADGSCSGPADAPAPGTADGLERLAAQMACLPAMPSAPSAQRQHSLRTLGEFGGVSSMWDLSDLVGGGGAAAAAGGDPPVPPPPQPQLVRQRQERKRVPLMSPAPPQQVAQAAPAVPPPLPQQQAAQQAQQQAQQAAAAALSTQQAPPAPPFGWQVQHPPGWPGATFGSPLPSVRNSDAEHAATRPSGPAALEALADLRAQQAQQGAPPPAPPVPVPLLGSPVAPHSMLSGSSGGYSLELGPPHLEVDERTGEAFLVQPVRGASDMSYALGSQLSESTTCTAQSSRPSDVVELVGALRASCVLDSGVLPLWGTSSFGIAPLGSGQAAPVTPTHQRTRSEPLLPLAGEAGAAAAGGTALAGGGAAEAAALHMAGSRVLHHSASTVGAAVGQGPAVVTLSGLLPAMPHPWRHPQDLPSPIPSPPSGPPRMSVPVEWEQLRALRGAVPAGVGAPASTGPPVALQRRHSSGDAGSVAPFGGQPIPEGYVFAPTGLARVAGNHAGSPFANGLEAVAAGGTLSLAAMQAAAGGVGRASDSSSLATASTADHSNSMHSNASEPLASMAGIVLEGLEEWEIQPDEIVLGPRIGIGSFGEVFRGIWRQTDVAVKRLLDQEVSPQMLEEFRQEISIMKRLRHPHIVQFLGAVTQPPHLCIVTQFVPRGSLFRLLHRTPAFNPDERRRLQMALDIARGMHFLHTCRPPIIHRDLKSPNLLVDKDLTVKVCDFGLSRARRSTMLSTKSQAGTPEWTAPEVLRSQPYNEKCDIYSYGVCLWELATNQEPWHDMSAMQVVGAVGWSDMRLPVPEDVPQGMRQLIAECFAEPGSRPSFSDIIPRIKAMIRALGPPPGQER